VAIESPISAEANWFKGEDKLLRFTVYGQDGKTPQLISDGWEFRFDLMRRRSTDALVTKATNAGVTVIDGTTGQIGVTINAEDTEALDGDSFSYVLRRVDVGNSQILAYGGVVLRTAEVA
jgi:hypothetical protein